MCQKNQKHLQQLRFNSAFEGGSVARDIWWTGDFAYSSLNKSGLQEVDLLEGRQLTVTNTWNWRCRFTKIAHVKKNVFAGEPVDRSTVYLATPSVCFGRLFGSRLPIRQTSTWMTQMIRIQISMMVLTSSSIASTKRGYPVAQQGNFNVTLPLRL